MRHELIVLCMLALTVLNQRIRVANAFLPHRPITKGVVNYNWLNRETSDRQYKVNSEHVISPRVLESNKRISKGLFASSSTSISVDVNDGIANNSQDRQIRGLKAALTKMGMTTFIASMCLTLPVAILPPNLLYKFRMISRVQKECLSLRAGEFCARWLLRLIPFARVKALAEKDSSNQEPTVWVCNHTSMLDVFFLMAMDKRLRGRKKRPIKIVYWKQLESNPVTRILFKSCGFIPINMAANKPGEENEYDRATFKQFLKDSKQAFNEGFDIGILPEGQLNPHPESGLLPIFPGAFTLAKMSRRPIRMMAMHGAHHLWHPDENVGMTVTGRDVKLRCYPGSLRFVDKDDFLTVFKEVVGYFGRFGQDLPRDKLIGFLRMGIEKKEEDPLAILGV